MIINTDLVGAATLYNVDSQAIATIEEVNTPLGERGVVSLALDNNLPIWRSS